MTILHPTSCLQTSIRLGASLYVPATRPDLSQIANGKIQNLKSLIFCLEDSVRDDQLDMALDNLAGALASMQPSNTLRFARVRKSHPLSSKFKDQKN